MAGKTTRGKSSGKGASRARKALGKIDLHHHFLPQRYMAEEQKRTSVTHGNTNMLSWTPKRSLEEMDKAGIDFAFASSSTPGVWYGDVDLGRRLAREWNNAAAEVIRDYPTRFGLFAPIPLPDSEGSFREIEYALDVIRADGIGLLSNYEGKWLGDPLFTPVFEELDRRKAIVYVHPTFTPCCTQTVPGLSMQTLEFPFETTRTVISLVTSGTTTRFRNIRWIFAHNGGATPMLTGRVEELVHRPIGKNFPAGMRTELRRFYYDTASAGNDSAMAALMNLAPITHIMFGSDYPFLAAREAVKKMAKVHLSRAARTQIDRDNALKLFPRLRKLH